MKTALLNVLIVVTMITHRAGYSGENPNVADLSEEHCIVEALRGGDLKSLEFLLEHKVSPNVNLESGSSALVLASLNLDSRFLELMLKNGGNPDNYNQNLKRNLIFEVLGPDRRKHLEVLLSYNPDIEALDGSKNTPLIYAAIISNYESMDLLLRKGANTGVRNRFGYSTLDILINNESRECKINVCKELLEIKTILIKSQ